MSEGIIKLSLLGKTDSEGNDYYFTRPRLPYLIDLSKVVLFIHPWEDDKKFGADLVIKRYTGSKKETKK